MNIHLVISTNNNTVNAIPLLMDEFKDNRVPVILSSEYAEKKHWTSNLQYVLNKKNITSKLLSFKDDENELDDKLKEFNNKDLYPSIYFNISGGKKNQILSLLSLYIERKNPEDKLIYVDSNPFKIKVYKGFKLADEYGPKCILNIEDVFNIYGFTCFNSNNTLENYVSSQQPEGLSIEKIRKINQYFLNNEDFAKFFYQYFAKPTLELEEKTSLTNKIDEILKNYKPDLQCCKNNVDDKIQKEYENIVRDLKRLRTKYQNNSKIDYADLTQCWKLTNRLINEEDIYNKYWGQIKLCIINELKQTLPVDKHLLFYEPEQVKNIVNICKEITSKNIPPHKHIYDTDIPQLLDINYTKGEFFEIMLSIKFYDIIKEKKPEALSRVYKNLQAYNLEYDNEGNAYLPDSKAQSVVEYDLVYLTEFGTISSFEAKTFGITGDVIKSKSYSAASQGGVFSTNIILTNIQKTHLKNEEFAKNYIPQSVRNQLQDMEKYRIDICYFDEIEDKLIRILSQK